MKLYFKVVEDQNRYIYKGGPRKIFEMKNKKEVQADRNEILEIFAHFYTELSRSPLQDQHPLQKNSNPHIRSPTDHDIRSQENPERNKNKAPGIDNLASDAMILAGD